MSGGIWVRHLTPMVEPSLFYSQAFPVATVLRFELPRQVLKCVVPSGSQDFLRQLEAGSLF